MISLRPRSLRVACFQIDSWDCPFGGCAAFRGSLVWGPHVLNLPSTTCPLYRLPQIACTIRMAKKGTCIFRISMRQGQLVIRASCRSIMFLPIVPRGKQLPVCQVGSIVRKSLICWLALFGRALCLSLYYLIFNVAKRWGFLMAGSRRRPQRLLPQGGRHCIFENDARLEPLLFSFCILLIVPQAAIVVLRMVLDGNHRCCLGQGSHKSAVRLQLV